MDNDLKQIYLDIKAKNNKRSKVFKRLILAALFISIVFVVLVPPLAALFVIGLFVLLLFLGVIYSIYTLAESEAESAYEATLEQDPNAKPKLNVDNVVENYVKGLGDERQL